jgi:hypothetical protein
MMDCQTDSTGWFEPTIGATVPADWPWALPAFCCINFAEDPGQEITGHSAKLDGSSQRLARFTSERYRVETVGSWHGNYRVVELQRFSNKSRAEVYATDQFESLPVRYLMNAGKVIRERPDINLTGEWPLRWEFKSIRDLGVFCAYVYENAMLRGAKDFAREFRASLVAAWPHQELLANYRIALMNAKQKVGLWASSKHDIANLNLAIEATLSWKFE